MHKMSEVEKSTVYCCILKNHERKASPCLDCFKAGISVSSLELYLAISCLHAAQNLPQDDWNQAHSEKFPNCISKLCNLKLSTVQYDIINSYWSFPKFFSRFASP